MAENIPPDADDGIPGIDTQPHEIEEVGYGRPPKQYQFKKGQSGNPKGRPKKIVTDQIQITSVLEAPVTATIKGKKEKIQVFEAGVRKLAQRSIQERHLTSTVRLLKLAVKAGLVQKPQIRQRAGIVEQPKDWDYHEWHAMLRLHGLPPWPGPRDGLSKPDRERLSAPPFNPQHVESPINRNIPRAKWSQKDILRHLLQDQHVMNEGGKRVKRTTLDLVVLVLKTHVASGSTIAMSHIEWLLEKYGTPAQLSPWRPVLIAPEPVTPEEWVMRYGAGTEEDRRRKVQELRNLPEE